MKMGPRAFQVKGATVGKTQKCNMQNYTENREIQFSEHWVSGKSSAK